MTEQKADIARPKSARLSVNINDETTVTLRRWKAGGTSATESIRKAVEVYRFLMDADRRGDRIELVARDGCVERVTFL